MIKYAPKLFSVISSLIIAITMGISCYAVDDSSQSNSKAKASEESYDFDSSITAIESNPENIENIISGNADLIKEQKIIHDSSEMQFIAVTTKAGNEFYILIDYTAVEDNKTGTGAVYFLNKVDEQDLYALINSDGEGENTTDDTSTEAIEEPVAEAQESQVDQPDSEPDSNNSMLYILLFIIAAVAIAAFYFLKVKPKKNAIPDDEEDDFEMDDYEINEDEENK